MRLPVVNDRRVRSIDFGADTSLHQEDSVTASGAILGEFDQNTPSTDAVSPLFPSIRENYGRYRQLLSKKTILVPSQIKFSRNRRSNFRTGFRSGARFRISEEASGTVSRGRGLSPSDREAPKLQLSAPWE